MSRLRRALLFMPGDSPRKIEKGAASGVDSIIMDLEDGVALNQKEAARQGILEALQNLDFGRSEKLVRINPIGSGLEEDDLAQTIAGQPAGYVIPKVEKAKHIEKVSMWLDAEERKRGWQVGSVRLFAIIESARGVVNLKDIAKASKRLEALLFGAEDLTASLGGVRRPDAPELAYARSAVLIHAKAYSLQAIDTPYVEMDNLEGLAAETQTIMHMGYDGKLAIHPKHIPVIVAAFNPSAAEVEKARALIAAHEAHQKSGAGVFSFEGKMVDMPIIRAAEQVLLRATSE